MRGIAAGIVIVASSSALSAQIVNIDGRADCSTAGASSTPVALDAGVYVLTPVGPPEGQFTALNKWGMVFGCDPSGSGCRKGWLYAFDIWSDAGVPVQRVLRGDIFSTPAAALAAAQPVTLRICESGTYHFLIIDDPCNDNDGGISLRIDPAPCPADLNLDGALDFFDFLAFQNLFAAGDPRANFDCTAALDFFDFLAFQNTFAAGC